MILLTALPCLGFMAIRPGNVFRRAVGVLGAVPVLYALTKTGSRAGLIGAAVMFVIIFFQAGMAQKAQLVVVGVMTVILASAVLPGGLTSRFTTIFGDGSEASDNEAIGSAYSRKMLLMDSLTLTITHPLFGVGPGMFPVAQDRLARDRGEPMGNWHLTHNTYTQVSSEAGFPGLVLFMAAIIHSYLILRRILRMQVQIPDWQEIRLIASTLRVSLLAFLSVAFFGSMAYLPLFTLLCGLVVAVEYAAEVLLASARKAPETAQPALSGRVTATWLPQQSPSRA